MVATVSVHTGERAMTHKGLAIAVAILAGLNSGLPPLVLASATAAAWYAVKGAVWLMLDIHDCSAKEGRWAQPRRRRAH
jgi:hypothetical protein